MRKRRPVVPGEAPGSLIADPEAHPSRITVIGFGPDELEELAIDDVAQIASLRGRWPVLWVNVDGLGDVDLIARLGETFALHKLALEDVINTNQRPKVDTYPNDVYFVTHIVRLAGDLSGIESEQISMFLGRDFVLTLQERPGDCFEPVRKRLRDRRPVLRGSGPDYLFYALADAVVDQYFPLMEQIGERIELLEELVLDGPGEDTLRAIRAAKRTLLALRRVSWPLRDAINSLTRESVPLIADATRVYLRDCHDHSLRILELTESYREQVSGLSDTYMSSVSQRMNEIMAVLTLVATIFIPLGFLAGLYGMNFDPGVSRWNMPELRWPYGYPFALALMGAVAGGMLLYFRHKGWIGRRR